MVAIPRHVSVGGLLDSESVRRWRIGLAVARGPRQLYGLFERQNRDPIRMCRIVRGPESAQRRPAVGIAQTGAPRCIAGPCAPIDQVQPRGQCDPMADADFEPEALFA